VSKVDMSARAVTARLKRVAELRPTRREVDMSPAAVTRRVRRVSQLRELCRKLGEFEVVE